MLAAHRVLHAPVSGGGGGSVNPSTLSGYTIDVDASTITGLSGGASVNSWPDEAGVCTVANGTATAPIYHTAVQNGLAGVKFNGLTAPGGMTIAGCPAFGSSGWAMFWVIEPSGSQPGGYANIGTQGSSQGFWYQDSGPGIDGYFGADHTDGIGTGAQVLAASVSAAGTLAFYLNGSAGSSYASLSPAMTLNCFGADSGGTGESFDGYFFRMIGVDQPVSPTNMVGVSNFLMTQWGI